MLGQQSTVHQGIQSGNSRRTGLIRPLAYKPITNTRTGCSSATSAAVVSTSTNNKLFNVTGDLYTNQQLENYTTNLQLPTRQRKNRCKVSAGRTATKQSNTSHDQDNSTTSQCNAYNKTLRGIPNMRVCDVCTMQPIPTNKSEAACNSMWNTNNKLHRGRVATKYPRHLESSQREYLENLMDRLSEDSAKRQPRDSMEQEIDFVSNLRDRLAANKSEELSQNRPDRAKQLWGIVREQLDSTGKAKAMLERREFINSKLKELVASAVERQQKGKSLNIKSRQMMNFISSHKESIDNYLSGQSNMESVNALIDSQPNHVTSRTSVNVQRPIYRTTSKAKTDVLDVRHIFTFNRNPSLRVRPSNFWTMLDSTNLLDNIKPVVTAIQANRLSSPFDCFLGEEWLTQHTKHNTLEKERLQSKLKEIRSAQRLGLTKYRKGHRATKQKGWKVDGDINLTVGEIWDKYGIQAQMKSKKRNLARNSEVDMEVVGAKDNVPQIDKEQQQLLKINQQGRRAALTVKEVKRIQSLRKTKKFKSVAADLEGKLLEYNLNEELDRRSSGREEPDSDQYTEYYRRSGVTTRSQTLDVDPKKKYLKSTKKQQTKNSKSPKRS